MKCLNVSDRALLSAQGLAMDLEQVGVKVDVQTISAETDVVGLVRACRQQKPDHIHSWKANDGQFCIATSWYGEPNLSLRAEL